MFQLAKMDRFACVYIVFDHLIFCCACIRVLHMYALHIYRKSNAVALIQFTIANNALVQFVYPSFCWSDSLSLGSCSGKQVNCPIASNLAGVGAGKPLAALPAKWEYCHQQAVTLHFFWFEYVDFSWLSTWLTFYV